MAADPTPRPTPPARPPRRLLRGVLLALLALVLVLPLVVGGGVAWLWHSPTGLQRALERVPGLSMQGVQGRPTGGPYAVQRLQWRGGGTTVVVEGLAWNDATWDFWPYPGAWVGLALQRPRASRVQVTTTPAPAEPASPRQLPRSLKLPVELSAPSLRVERVEIDQQPPLTELSGDLHVGAATGTEHRLQNLSLVRENLALTGDLVIGTTGPMTVAAQVTAATRPGAEQAGQVTLNARGPLRELAVDAQLRHTSGAAANAQATVAPFAAWPLLGLVADARALDLRAFAPTLPQTRLSGRATMAEPTQAQTTADPLSFELALDNAEPGAWDAGRLPLRSVQLQLRGRPSEPGTLEFERVEAVLSGDGAAGTVQGSGRWQGRQLSLALRLQDLQPARLDRRAPAMDLQGRLTLSLDGVAVPTGAAVPAAAAPATGLTADMALDITGRLPRRGTPPLTLQADARVALPPDGSLQLTLSRARARAGPQASADATASVTRNAAGVWRARSSGELRRFDPAPWWPAAATPAAGPQQINGRWVSDLGWDDRNPVLLTSKVNGTARLTLDDTRLAGLTWQGQADLQADAQALQATADFSAGPNRLQARGNLPRGTRTPLLQGDVDVQAPALAALAPLARLLPAGAAAWWPTAGSITAQAHAEGSWPTVKTTGTLRASGVRSQSLQVGQAYARWDLATTDADSPLSLQLGVADLAYGERRLDRLDATLQGSVRQHALELRASSPLRPPAWTDAAAGGTTGPPGSSFSLQGRGSWSPVVAGGGTWRGALAQLRATPRGTDTRPWLSVDDVQATVVLDAGGQPRQASLAPGRVSAFGGALAWQQASWQAAATPAGAPRIELLARIEPIAVAPWLVRLQPQFGWQGDLALGGTIAVRSAERVDADIVIERTGGDLSLTVEGATRSLGLNNLRVGLAAHNGQWEFTQALVGNSIGVVGGLQSITTSPQALWPGPTAPLTGGLSLQVPELGVWAPWLPPGWRLGGQLRIAAAFTGRVGAPEYRGEVTGENLAVRNLFEGIHLRDGTLAMGLTGTQATVSRFEFRDGAGSGVLRVTGGATFGETQRAQLRAVADKFRVLDRFDRRIMMSGTSDLDLQPTKFVVGGDFTIDEGLVDATQADAPSSDTDVIVLNRAPLRRPGGALAAASPEARPPGPARSPLGLADVNLRLDLGNALRLRGRGLDTLLKGRLRITTPEGRLAVNGFVDAQGGTYTAYGQNLRIDRGGLRFSGDVATPQLDILALRADIDQRVGVVVTGGVINPRVRLYSEPELGQLDTLTWLLLGRAPEGLGRDDTALLQRAALALLAGERGGDGIIQKLGLDELSLRRGNGTDGTLGETIVSLGKQISKRVYVGYEQALGAAGGTVQLIYRIANRITLRARTGAENAVDAIWTWRWD